jgi:tetratricopeptide (TPR) repeat protein
VTPAPSPARAYMARARVRLLFQWDQEGNVADVDRALALSPSDPLVVAIGCGSSLGRGKFTAAIPYCKQAIELDPLDHTGWQYLTFIYAAEGKLDLAKAANARVLELSPDSTMAWYYRCRIAFLSGELAAATDLCAKLSEETDRLTMAAVIGFEQGDASGGARALQDLIAKVGDTKPGVVARVFAWRGEKDQAFEWLERAYTLESSHKLPVFLRHTLLTIKYEPLFRKLHGDPRYTALLQKLKLPPD